jgi:hypothetical protein
MQKGLLSQSAQPAQQGAPTSQPTMSEEEATPQEQEAYEVALSACSKIIHGDDKAHEAVMKMIDEREKIGSVAKTAVTIITQVDSQIDMPETVLAGVLAQVVDWLIELAETGKGMPFNDREQEQVMATATELMLEVYGVDEDDYQGMVGGMDDAQIQGYQQQYQGLLND